MKLFIALLCLLLCGCSAEAAQLGPAPTTTPVTEPVLLLETDHPFAQDGLSVFSLPMEEVQGLRGIGNNLLVFSGRETTTLTLLSGENLHIIRSVTLDIPLLPTDSSLRIQENGLSFFDPVSRKTLIFNECLEQVGKINAPRGLLGSPVLTDDRNLMYYCTADAIRVWEQGANIHRTLKQLSHDNLQLTGLHLNETVLQCQIEDGSTTYTLFLSAETGQQLAKLDGEPHLITQEGRYYASLPAGSLDVLIFGNTEEKPQILYPDDLTASHFILPGEQAVVTLSKAESNTVVVDYYSLDTGLRTASFTLAAAHTPKNIISFGQECVYLLISDPATGHPLLCLWKPAFSPSNDSHIYTDSYASKDTANYEALAQCTAYAESLSKKYGLRIQIGKDAAAVQPWDYRFEPETLHRVIMEELELLDIRLSAYPREMLDVTASHFDSLNLCLVRQISGTASSGSLHTATGIQFLEDGDAYVVLAVGQYAEQALYHELFHVMETHIMSNSSAFDHWDSLNPAGFSYDYDYQANQSRNSGVYLEKEHRSFIDSYSMSFPKEDRARIMEYAMLPDQKDLFQTSFMQNKLLALCKGIREAYDLEDSEEDFLWEQYLQ